MFQPRQSKIDEDQNARANEISEGSETNSLTYPLNIH